MAIDINEQIAERQIARDMKEGSNAGFRDADSIRASSDRTLPWWVGTGAGGQGNLVLRPGLATVEEALTDGGLDFDVALRPVLTMGAGGRLTKIDTHSAVVRLDTGAVLGIVGRKYRAIQFRDGLGEFGKAILATDGAAIETAGTMYGGRVGILSFELDALKGVKVAGEKAEGEIRTYLLLSTSHDGSMALQASITPVRWVCKNTLNFALRGARSTFKVRHSGGVADKYVEARRVLGITIDYLDRFEAVANLLAARAVPDAAVFDVMKNVWPVPEALSPGWQERHSARLATDLYFTSDTLSGIRGTAWGVLNAVAEFVDHELPYKGRQSDQADVRASAILWGRGVRAKDRALAVLQEL